eukprot:TRINITY_DN584_c0_g1_i1.p1 TRINITY_DN584_c0_g1~~TRINITY_DN584_c0_g1_i1.p1  ORF type:complete len:638 (+),score=65.52 TRINITY_DN584_c0_g1_i1:1565-3478(+)
MDGPVGGKKALGAAAKPQLLVCYLCGQQFGTSSLAIHQPQCYQKKLTEWKNGDKNTRGPKPRDPATVESAPTSLRNPQDIDAFNQQQFGDFTQNLAQCQNCGRRFLPDRLQVHLRSCNPGASGKGSKPIKGRDAPQRQEGGPKSSSSEKPAFKPQLLVCYLCGQQFGTASLPIHQPQCYTKKMIEWEKADPGVRGPKPKNPSEQGNGLPVNLRDSSAVEAFNNQNFEHYNDNLASCPNCGRTFNPTSLVVHLRSCKPGASGGGSKPVHGKAQPSPLNDDDATPPSFHPSKPNPRRPPTQQPGDEESEIRPASKGRSPLYNRLPTAAQGAESDEVRTSTEALHGRRSKVSPPTNTEEIYAHPDGPLRNRAAKQKPSSEAQDEEKEENEDPTPHAEYNLDNIPEPDSQDLVPCSNCGRKFAAARLPKHEQACTGQKKRKTFNSYKNRIQGTEMVGFQQAAHDEKKATQAPKTGKWLEQHKQLQEALKTAKQIAKIQKEGGNLADLPPPPPSENPDYVQCPHCSRRFAPHAAERHIPSCANTTHKPKAPPKRPQTTERKENPTVKPKPKPAATAAGRPRVVDPPSAQTDTPPLPPLSAGTTAAKPAAKPGPRRAMFCTECGTKYPDEAANFCQECGTKRA